MTDMIDSDWGEAEYRELELLLELTKEEQR